MSSPARYPSAVRFPRAMATIFLACLASLSLMACGTVHVSKEWDAVRTDAVARTGVAPVWIRSAEDEAFVRAETDRLLAEGGGGLTLDAAVRIALMNNRDLQAVFEDIGVAKADLVQAGLFRNPSLSALFRFPLYSGGERSTDIEYGGSLSLADLWQIPVRKRLAGVQMEQAILRVSQTVLDTATEAKAAWLAVYYLDQARAADLAGAGAALSQETRTLAGFGLADDLQARQASVEAAKARIEQREAEAEAELAKARLARILGQPGPLALAGRPSEVPAGPAKPLPDPSTFQDRRIDIRLARLKVSEASRRVTVERSQIVGRADLTADYEKNPDGTEIFGPGLDLELPLFDQGLARMAKARFELRRAEKELAAIQARISEDIMERSARVTLLRARADGLEQDIIPAQAQAAAFAERYAMAMQATRLSMLQIRRELAASRRDLARTRAELARANAELERTLGSILP